MRITQRDLAKKLGISQVTVSRALAGSPLVADETKLKICREADKLGYVPDPVLGSLNAYRRTRMPIGKGQTLAWISDQQVVSHLHYKGAAQRAQALGFRLEAHIESRDMPLTRILTVLSSRGISGLIFGPRRTAHAHLDLNLSRFSAIAFGYSIERPELNRVITDHHKNMMIAYQKMIEHGCKRIGLILNRDSDVRIEGRRYGAYHYMLWENKHLAKIPMLSHSNKNELKPTLLKKWIERWKPDGILCYQPAIWGLCKDIGLRVPEDINLVAVSMNGRWPEFTRWAGVDERLWETGALAVEALVSQLHNNERGIPNRQKVYLLKGCWQDGHTLRLRN